MVDHRERVPAYPRERPAVGLIICASAEREEVRYALGGLEERIVVAEYRRKLPSEAAIGVGLGRATYGEQTLAQLGRILGQEFGRSFGERSLQLMRQFYLAYPMRNALRSELGWTHYRALMRLPDSERDLEAAILRNSERFLLELGTDCCFVARQRRLTIDGEDYHIDLVFYHRSLRCLVL